MENVTITLTKNEAYELELILRERINGLLFEKKNANENVKMIIQRQLNRAMNAHDVVCNAVGVA